MAFMKPSALLFNTCDFFGAHSTALNFLPRRSRSFTIKPLVVEARSNARKETAKTRNRRIQKKFNGTSTKPRLSVFCSDKQLYAMLVDDQNKKCLFYGSTLQKSIRRNPPCTTVEAAECVGEELIQTCIDLNINEVSSYDRNGCARGARMQAFEIAISRHGFLPQ
ncbi:50S ribosomal protein L18 [Mangifera indica]|uniref:50S ribosomal protein L18 n=1 Tax=Mangifera indica TaxID=29780 RepID=UPI001CF99EB5|nr:50S ribosomal protein L18 [Mangifera indica]